MYNSEYQLYTYTHTSYCKQCKENLPIENFITIYVKSYDKFVAKDLCIKCERTRKELDTEINKKSRHRLKIKAIKKLGSECKCCGVKQWWNLTIDHVTPISKSNESREPSVKIMRMILNNPFERKKYQCMCFGCNISKGNRESCCIDHTKSYKESLITTNETFWDNMPISTAKTDDLW